MDQAPPSASPPRRGWAGLLAVALLIMFWWSGVSASRHWSQTSDELPHITGGYAYDRFGDFRVQPENGNLPQRVHGLAPLALGARFPMDNEDYWRRSVYWQLGWDFLYGLDNPTDRMVQGARALNALFGVALGAFIFVVARRWYGDAGGLLALGFYVFCPNFIAHSALATSDMAAALFLTLGPWCFWVQLEKRSLATTLLAGTVAGLALVAKFNGVLLAPIFTVMIVADVWLRGAANRKQRLLRNGALTAGTAGLAVLIIWLFYGFRYSTAAPNLPPLEAFPWAWDKTIQDIGLKGAVIQVARDWHLLPEAWLYGLSVVLTGSLARPSFLAGEYSLTGWWQFFPTLFLVKTPLAFLVAMSTVLGLGAMRWQHLDRKERLQALGRWLPVTLSAATVWLTALAGNLNIGHRHILATYPVLFIASGSLVSLGRRWLAVPVVLLAGQMAESLAIRPNYVAFFNPLAGGPAKAYRLVVDSSLDWGQSLPDLRDWLGQHRLPNEPFYLSYFGSAWPLHYGVRPTHFLPSVTLALPPPMPYSYDPGLYCISATMLSETYDGYNAPWRPEWERSLKDPATPAPILDQLRFARLCKYLQHRPPDAEAGFSILIFRLTAAELRAALEGPVTGW